MEPKKAEGEGCEALSDSWIEMHFTPLASRKASSTDLEQSAASLEKLLKDAQREQLTSSPILSSVSCMSNRHSPKELLSPASESPIHMAAPTQRGPSELQITEWMWDWSSRPENVPPSHMKHLETLARAAEGNDRGPGAGGLFDYWPLPLTTTLMVTHACSFTVGAALVLLLMKKYYSRV